MVEIELQDSATFTNNNEEELEKESEISNTWGTLSDICCFIPLFPFPPQTRALCSLFEAATSWRTENLTLDRSTGMPLSLSLLKCFFKLSFGGARAFAALYEKGVRKLVPWQWISPLEYGSISYAMFRSFSPVILLILPYMHFNTSRFSWIYYPHSCDSLIAMA